MRTLDALDLAKKKGLDLVEVAPKAKPPVCRIMDYGKYRYKQSKREQEARKKQHQVTLKEIKLRPKTGEHDYQFKVKHIERFLGDGDKVKVTIMFRGREMTHPDIGRGILERIIEHFGERVDVEKRPHMDGRNMTMILSANDLYDETAGDAESDDDS